MCVYSSSNSVSVSLAKEIRGSPTVSDVVIPLSIVNVLSTKGNTSDLSLVSILIKEPKGNYSFIIISNEYELVGFLNRSTFLRATSYNTFLSILSHLINLLTSPYF